MNTFEQRVLKAYQSRGWVVLRNGWPDFLLTRGMEVIAVEAKHGDDLLSSMQRRIHSVLARAGIPVHVVRDEDLVHLESTAAWRRPGKLRKTTVQEKKKTRKDLVRKLHEAESLACALAVLLGEDSTAIGPQLTQNAEEAA